MEEQQVKKHVSHTKSLAKPEKMAMEVLLQRYRLQEYFQFFEKAGYNMLDVSAKFNDHMVEYILSDVEKQNSLRFKPDIRVRLWKALRHIWMNGMRPAVAHITDHDMPRIFLPKKDYRQIDSMVKMSELDPDRQRQVIRKTKPVVSTGRGPGIQTMQFEVYKRQNDLWYDFKDLQRCVTDWQHKNPRTMLQEDPREEVMKLRIRHILERTNEELKRVVQKGHVQFYTWLGLMGLQLIMGLLTLLMLMVMYMAHKDSPTELYLVFMGGSKQLISCCAFFQAFIVAYVVTQRRRVNPMVKRYSHACVSAERLMEQISDFRFETYPVRIVPEDQRKDDRFAAPRRPKAGSKLGLLDGAAGALGAKAKEQQKAAAGEKGGARERKKKQKKLKLDPALEMWMDNAAIDESALGDKKVMMKAIEESYRLLPLPEGGIQRRGGNRMVQFEGRLGGANDDELSIAAHSMDRSNNHRRGILDQPRHSGDEGWGGGAGLEPPTGSPANLPSNFSSRRPSGPEAPPPPGFVDSQSESEAQP